MRLFMNFNIYICILLLQIITNTLIIELNVSNRAAAAVKTMEFLISNTCSIWGHRGRKTIEFLTRGNGQEYREGKDKRTGTIVNTRAHIKKNRICIVPRACTCTNCIVVYENKCNNKKNAMSTNSEIQNSSKYAIHACTCLFRSGTWFLSPIQKRVTPRSLTQFF